jgi:hypothetical protein
MVPAARKRMINPDCENRTFATVSNSMVKLPPPAITEPTRHMPATIRRQ